MQLNLFHSAKNQNECYWDWSFHGCKELKIQTKNNSVALVNTLKNATADNENQTDVKKVYQKWDTRNATLSQKIKRWCYRNAPMAKSNEC
jgi:hypothetical protein